MADHLVLLKSDLFAHEQQAVVAADRYPQDVFAEYTHEFCELVMVQCGDGLCVLNDCPYRITRGDLFYIRVEDKHSYTSVNNLVLRNIVYCPERLTLNVDRQGAVPGLNDTPRQLHWRLGSVDMSQVRQVISQFEHESNQRDTQAFTMAELLLGQLVTHLKRYCYATDTLSAISSETLLDKLITALAGSHEHMFELDTFYERERCDECALCQQFRSQTGMITNQYLHQVRVCHTQYLLKYSRLMISETSMCCGSEDSNYSSVVFARETGAMPSQWRHLST